MQQIYLLSNSICLVRLWKSESEHWKKIADIASLEDLEPLSLNIQAPQPNVPSGLNMESSYSLFRLSLTDEIFEKASNSTNAYAHLKRETDEESEKS
jgi:hypothetical protein